MLGLGLALTSSATRRNSGAPVDHLIWHGQSLSDGTESFPVMTTSGIAGNAHEFARGIRTWSAASNPTAPASRPGSDFALVGIADGAAEMPSIATAHLGGLDQPSRRVLSSYAGEGGRRIGELGPLDNATNPANSGTRGPGGYWPTLLDDMGRARALGGAYRPALFWNQGQREGDLRIDEWLSPTTFALARASYQSRFADVCAAFKARASELGAADTAPVIAFSTNNWVADPAINAVCNPASGIYLAGPTYMAPTAYNSRLANGNRGDPIHLSADGQRWVHAEQGMKVLRRVRAGEAWRPLTLHPDMTAARRISSTVVEVDLYVPRPPLVLDTTNVPRFTGWGFTAYQGSTADSLGARNGVTAITVVADGTGTQKATVRLTLASALPGGAGLIRTAWSTFIDGIVYNPQVVSVSAGPTVDGQATTDVVVAGDHTTAARLGRIAAEGAGFLAWNFAPGTYTDWRFDTVSYNSGTNQTTLRGETRNWRSGVQMVAGGYFLAGRISASSNIRDSDPEVARLAFADPAYGSRQGQLYPLHNWMCPFEVAIAA